jgi:hypothetical protein
MIIVVASARNSVSEPKGLAIMFGWVAGVVAVCCVGYLMEVTVLGIGLWRTNLCFVRAGKSSLLACERLS